MGDSVVVISLKVAFTATLLCVLVGIPLAKFLAHRTGVGVRLIRIVSSLPLVLPPTVVGWFLLTVFSSRRPLGQWLESIGLPLVFDWKGAAVAAFLGSLPLFLGPAVTAFESIDRDLPSLARTLGLSRFRTFLRVTLPLAAPGIWSGLALGFARALGDFGASLVVAGNIPGSTKTLSMSIYDAIHDSHDTTAWQLILVSLVIAFAALAVADRQGRRTW